MKKTLIVMRHGKAMPAAQGQPDDDRELSEAGRAALEARLPHMTHLLKTRGKVVEIWTSPARRACQTAALLEQVLQERQIPLAKAVDVHECLGDQNVDQFFDDLVDSEAAYIVAVGHVPFVEDIVEGLTGSTPRFSTGALGCLELQVLDVNAPSPIGDARLAWFVQGPLSAHWGTLIQLQEALAEMADAIEDRRAAFFADPADTETIHRFRTRIRTLRSLVAFIKPWQNRGQNAETQLILRDTVRHTSLLRELDVLEKQVRANPDSSHELIALCEHEATLERGRVLKTLRSARASLPFERAMALTRNVTWKRRYAKHGLEKEAVQARFDALVASVTADVTDLDLHDAEQTHDVRKRTKRARYVAERCHGILEDNALEVAKGMNSHQDTLGDICDARANIRLLDEFLRHDPPQSVARELKLMRTQNVGFLRDALRG